MSKKDKKDVQDNPLNQKDFTWNPIYDPIFDPLGKMELEGPTEHIQEELRKVVGIVLPEVKPLPEMQPPMPDLGIPSTMTSYYMFLENEISNLKADIKQLKTIIFKLEAEIQTLKSKER